MFRTTAEFLADSASDSSSNSFPSSSCFQLHPRFLSSLLKDDSSRIGVSFSPGIVEWMIPILARSGVSREIDLMRRTAAADMFQGGDSGDHHIC